MNDLAKRVRRLERINLALAVALGLACLMAASRGNDAKFDKITARELVIVNGKGVPRINLATQGDTDAEMTISGGKEGTPVVLGILSGSPMLRMSPEGDFAGTIRLGFDDDKTANLWATDTHADLIFEVPKGKTTMTGKNRFK